MITTLVRKQINNLPAIHWGELPYEGSIRLLWGENPLVVNICMSAIKKDLQNLSLYPDPTKSELRQLLATYNLVFPENIFLTNGSDEAIELLTKVFISENDEVIIPTPSFPVYESSSLLMGAIIKKIPLQLDFSLDMQDILSAITKKTKILWIANPNNPTGNVLLTNDQIERLAQHTTMLIVIDECYYELANQTAVALIKRYPNIIIIRSFSKVFGLAGARLGYVIADNDVISVISRVQLSNQVFSVNRFAIIAATALLKHPKILQRSIKKFNLLKKEFEVQLASIKSIRVLPTLTTFCLIKLSSRCNSAATIRRSLQTKRVYIKDCTIYDGLGSQYLYIGIPRCKDQQTCIELFKKYFISTQKG